MLKLEDLCIAYDQKAILDHVNFTFSDHKTTALVGASGIGKTTLLRAIAGLVKPTEGQIISSYQRVAYMFQEPRLFPWMTALENVSIVCRDEEKVRDLFNRLQLTEDSLAKYPHELSGGMRQRVSIARAMAYMPDLLLMDEPFKGLDPETRSAIADFFFNEMKGTTVLMVTHDRTEDSFCHQILRMEGSPVTGLILEKSNILPN